MTFRELWLDSVARKNSVLCAGIDPAPYEMGRGEKGLREGVDKLEWSIDFMKTVAPYVAAFKPNLQYWLAPGKTHGFDQEVVMGDMEGLEILVALAHDLETPIILDAKIADIGSTNETGAFYHVLKDFDAITIAPFAGNMEQFATYGQKWDLGLITMCLMSNPEYEAEKRSFKPIRKPSYDFMDTISLSDGLYVQQYMKLAHDAEEFGIDGIVIGAPSEKNHVTDDEIAKAAKYAPNRIVLMPGVDAQGGEAQAIWKHFPIDNVIVNVGRGLMFPEKTRDLTVDAWRDAAKMYCNMLNEHRDAA